MPASNTGIHHDWHRAHCAETALYLRRSGRVYPDRWRCLSEQNLADLGKNQLRPILATVNGAAIPFPFGGKDRQVMLISFTRSAVAGPRMTLKPAELNTSRIETS